MKKIHPSSQFKRDYKVFRFCGSTEMTSELKEDIMKRIPEYDIIGVKIER